MNSMSGRCKIPALLAVLATMNVAAAADNLTFQEVVAQNVTISGDGPGFRFVPSNSAGQDVRIKFLARDGVVVDPASIRIHYGRFGIDITDRLLEHGHMDSHEISIDCNILPLGEYRVRIEVMDTQRRQATMKMRLVVNKVTAGSNPPVENKISTQRLSEKADKLVAKQHKL
jgi:hypothetical protein